MKDIKELAEKHSKLIKDNHMVGLMTIYDYWTVFDIKSVLSYFSTLRLKLGVDATLIVSMFP